MKEKNVKSKSFINTCRNGFGCSINPAENLVTFGMWIPCGAIILKEKVTTNEEAIELLKKTGDIFSYKRKIEQKS